MIDKDKKQQHNGLKPIMLIGPLAPPYSGGSRRLFSLLVDELTAFDFVKCIIVNSRLYGLGHGIAENFYQGMRTIALVLLNLFRCSLISFHASNRGMCVMGPILYLVAKLFGKPIIIRLFGGTFDEYYFSLNYLSRWLIRNTVLKSDLCLFETKKMLKALGQLCTKDCQWFPNYDRIFEHGHLVASTTDICSRFVFIGRVTKDKGIDIILNSAPRLPNGVCIDIYGYLFEYTPEEINRRGQGRVVYKGLVSPAELGKILWNYHALVLPTYYRNEGYPGAIIEAYSHGLPVIATNWSAICEIVDYDSGILIQPKSEDALVAAIYSMHFDPQLYARLKNGAKDKGLFFTSERWSRIFVDWCLDKILPSTNDH